MIAAAGLLSGCGTASSTPAAGAAAAPGSQFDPGLVPRTTSTTPSKTAKRGRHAPAKHRKPARTKPAKRPAKAPAKSKPKAASPSAASTPTVHSTTAAPPATPAPQTVTVTVTRTTPTPTPKSTPSTAVPRGPQPASTEPVLTFSRFTVADANIGCSLGGGVARCDIASRDWSPPPRPKSCQLTWGHGLTTGLFGAPGFVCAADSVLDPDGPIVAIGRDDSYGGVTCQVRFPGVTCFNDTKHGFFLSRTNRLTF